MAAPTKGNQQVYITGVGVTDTVHTVSSYTPAAGSDRYLCVRIVHDSATVGTVSSATFGGVSMGTAILEPTEGGIHCTTFALAEADWPGGGSGDVVVNLAETGGCAFVVDTIIGTSGVDSFGGASNINNANSSASLTTTVDECVVLAQFGGNDARTVSSYNGGAATEDYENANALEAGSLDVGRANFWTLADAGTAGSVTMTINMNNGCANDALAAVAFAPAASGSSTAPTGEVTFSTFDISAEISNIDVTVNPEGELVFSTFDLLADDFTVFLSGFSEIVFSPFSTSGGVTSAITAVLSGTVTLGTELTLAAASLLQRIATGTISFGFSLLGTITGGDPVSTGIELIRKGSAYVRDVMREIVQKIVRRY